MSESTLDMLTKHIESVAEDIAEYARQIESGEYGNRWTVDDGETGEQYTVIATNEDDAIEAAKAKVPGVAKSREFYAVLDSFDQPTIVDDADNETPIDEFPLSVEVKIGRPLAVVIGTGGPHIEIVQDLSDGSAKLAGYWGGEKVFRHGDQYQTVLDYFTDELWESAPEEYK